MVKRPYSPGQLQRQNVDSAVTIAARWSDQRGWTIKPSLRTNTCSPGLRVNGTGKITSVVSTQLTHEKTSSILESFKYLFSSS